MRTALIVFSFAAVAFAQPAPRPTPTPTPPAPPAGPRPRVYVDTDAINAEVQAKIQAKIDESRMRRGEDRNYQDGAKYLDRGEWDRAVEAFNAVVAAKGERVEGAHYWKAYALGRAGKRDEALATINELEKGYPKSRWLDDAKALRVELRQAAGQSVSADLQNDEELRLIALNGLMDTAPDKAIPVLRDLLKKTSSPRLKERTLYVLAQSDSPQSREVLVQYAKGGGNPDLQLKAVEYLGTHRNRDNLGVLADIYQSGDSAIRKRVLRAYMSARDKDRIFQAARTEQDPDVRREAIMFLGGLRADAELMQLYPSETNLESKRRIMESLAGARSAKGLVEIARKESNPELKREAVRMLSNMKSQEATDYLMELLK